MTKSSTLVPVLALCFAACTFANVYAFSTAPAPAPGMEASCTLTTELEEGPYYLDDILFRSNITEDQIGIPLVLRIKVVNTDCEPLADTFVDIWHCNGTGFYSGYTLTAGAGDSGQTSATEASAVTPSGSASTPSGAPSGTSAPSSEAAPSGTMATTTASSPEGSTSAGSSTTSSGGQTSTVTDTLTWLRGIVQTDEDGIAEFETIVPGWYSGRAPHIHIKVHVPYNTTLDEYDQYEDSHLVHTSQVFFADSLYDQIAVTEPYIQDTVTRVLTADDRVYAADTTAVLDVVQDDSTLTDGLVAMITAVIDENATSSPASEQDSSQSSQGGSSTTSAPSIPTTSGTSSANRRLLTV